MTNGTTRRAVLRVAAAVSLSGARPLAAIANRQSDPPILRRGINTFPWFSLTREFPPPRTDYDWPPFQETRPVPTSKDLHRLSQAGLDFIRIPVDPGPFIAALPQQREILLDMLIDAVQTALRADLTVIVNIQANGATHFWNPERMLSGPQAPGFGQYRKFVRDVALRLGMLRNGRTILEPANEPGQSCVSDVWSQMQHDLIKTARTAAPDLTLVATGGCGSMVPGLVALDPRPLQAFKPILYTFHFYEPYLFSHQGAPWMREPVYRSLNSVPWPASSGSSENTLSAVRAQMAKDHETAPEQKKAAYEETVKVLKVYFDAQPDRSFIDRYLDMISDWGRNNGIDSQHILMGEFGALRTDSRYTAAHTPDRTRYINDVRQSAEQHGFPWAFWNMFDGMGMVDDSTRAFDPAVVGALGLAMPSDNG